MSTAQSKEPHLPEFSFDLTGKRLVVVGGKTAIGLGVAPLAHAIGAAVEVSRPFVMTEVRDLVIVVEDDPDVRNALGGLMRSLGLEVQLNASPAEFFQSERADAPTCIVLDVRLPRKNGLEFQRDLIAAGLSIPIVFISAHGDIPMTVEALKAGAIDFLTKPVRDQDLIKAVQSGLSKDRERRAKQKVLLEFRGRVDSLSPREREIFIALVAGRSNKVIAADIGISEVTVKFHRGNIMRKMGPYSLAELAVMAERLRADIEGR